MEFNGINNETNGIDGFERRLSERASAIDYWLSEVKSINQLAGEKPKWAKWKPIQPLIQWNQFYFN